MKKKYIYLLIILLSFLKANSIGLACEQFQEIEKLENRLHQLPLEFQNSVQKIVSKENPDWISLRNYAIPTSVKLLVPYQCSTFYLNGTIDRDAKSGMYLAVMSDNLKYFLKEVRFDHEEAFGEIIAYQVSKKLKFDLVPPCFLHTFIEDTLGFNFRSLESNSFEGENISLKSKTFTAHYFVESKTFYSYLVDDQRPLPASALKNFYQGNLLRGMLGFRDDHLGNQMCGWGRLILIDNESCFEKKSQEIHQTYLTSFIRPEAAFNHHFQFSKNSSDTENLKLVEGYRTYGAQFYLSSEVKEKLMNPTFWNNLFKKLKKQGINKNCSKFKQQPWIHAKEILELLTI